MFYCRLLHHPWQENAHSHSAQIKCKKPSHTFLSFISKHPIVSCLMSKRGTPTTETNLMYRLFCSSYSSLGNLSLPIIIITMQILLACLFNWKQPFGCSLFRGFIWSDLSPARTDRLLLQPEHGGGTLPSIRPAFSSRHPEVSLVGAESINLLMSLKYIHYQVLQKPLFYLIQSKMKRKMALESGILIPGNNAGVLAVHLFFLVFK